jgi:hypoxanthine phosphoribosyltransferase
MTSKQLHKILADSDCLFTLEQTEQALARMAEEITAQLQNSEPIVIGVMNGALVTMGYLLPRLPFLLEVDYVHATRYQGQQQGSELVWKRKPELDLQGRQVLLVDDILDQGITLAAIARFCLDEGAAGVAVAVLGVKRIANFTPVIAADYQALEFPDRYVFGFGMDYNTFWRNAPGIYAVKP